MDTEREELVGKFANALRQIDDITKAVRELQEGKLSGTEVLEREGKIAGAIIAIAAEDANYDLSNVEIETFCNDVTEYLLGGKRPGASDKHRSLFC